MVAYLNDWLIFGPDLPAQYIVRAIQDLGFTLNLQKSVLNHCLPRTSHRRPTTAAGSNACMPAAPVTTCGSCTTGIFLGPGPDCRLCGLPCMGSCMAHLCCHPPLQPRYLRTGSDGFISPPCLLHCDSRPLYSDATPSSIAGPDMGPPCRIITREYDDEKILPSPRCSLHSSPSFGPQNFVGLLQLLHSV